MKKIVAVFLIVVMTLVMGVFALGCDEEQQQTQSWQVGTTQPTSEVKGSNGNLYLDSSTGTVYLYGNEGWVKFGKIQLEGEESSGSQWYTGTSAPTIDAKQGDFYIDRNNFVIYEMTADGWTEICNFKGGNEIIYVGGSSGDQE